MIKKIIKWGFIVLAVGYLALVVGRAFYLEKQDRIQEQVDKIHATKLTLADVMGDNLPPVPENPDATIEGVDANKNGIRDDVELAIFEKYPDSAKTRAVLLQYALALQMEVQNSVIDDVSVVNVLFENDSRAGDCIADILVPRDSPEASRSYEDIEKIDSYLDFVDSRQFNNEKRKREQEKLYKKMGSYSSYSGPACDINTSALSN